ncbi:hypothetical protein Tco_0146426 [Tanacetum coccineum]
MHHRLSLLVDDEDSLLVVVEHSTDIAKSRWRILQITVENGGDQGGDQGGLIVVLSSGLITVEKKAPREWCRSYCIVSAIRGFFPRHVDPHCSSSEKAKISFYHFIKEQVENGVVELYFVRTEYQLVDIFTKALCRDRIEFLIDKLRMRSFTPETLKELADEAEE